MPLRFLPPVPISFDSLHLILVTNARQAVEVLSGCWPDTSSDEFDAAVLACFGAIGGSTMVSARGAFERAAREASVLVQMPATIWLSNRAATVLPRRFDQRT